MLKAVYATAYLLFAPPKPWLSVHVVVKRGDGTGAQLGLLDAVT